MASNYIHFMYARCCRMSLCLFSCLFMHMTLTAQVTVNIDSLQIELEKALQDTTRINALNELSYGLIKMKVRIDEANKYAQQALVLSQQLGYKKGEAYANMNFGMLEVANRNFTPAFEKYSIAKDLLLQIQDTLGLARFYHKFGNLYFAQKKRAEGIAQFKIAVAMYDALVRYIPTESNTYRLNESLKISEQALFISDYVAVLKYAQKGYALAESMGKIDRMAEAMVHIGSIDFDQENFVASIPNLKRSLELYEQVEIKDIGVIHNMSWINHSLGLAYSRHAGDIQQGLKHYKASMKIDEEVGDEIGISENMLQMAFDLAAHELFTEALEQNLALLAFSEKRGDTLYMGLAHRYMGDVFYNNRNFDAAEKHFAIAMKLFETRRDRKIDLARILHKMGLIQMGKNNKEGAIEIFTSMKSKGEEISDTHLIVTAYTNLFLLGVSFEHYDEILKFFLTAIQKLENKGDVVLTMDTYRFVGLCYSEMGDYENAEKYFTKSLELAKKLGNTKGITSGLSNLKKTKYKMHEFDKAVEYADMLAYHKDSLSDESNKQMLAEVLTKYETEKKDNEILRLESEKQLSALDLQIRDESIKRIRSERDHIQLQNLFQDQQLTLMANEKELQQYVINQHEANTKIHLVESEKQQSQLNLLNREAEIQKLALHKQKQVKNLALGGLGLFCFLSFMVYSNYRTRQQLKLQVLRNKIASDLHDDVGSTLSSIKLFSEIAQQQSPEVIPMLETIGESSKRMLDAMADIVWSINPENDHFEKIILRMRNFAFDFLGTRNINFEFIADEKVAEIKLPMETRKNLYLIFKEATNNLVKYSGADKAHFLIKEEKDVLTMEIRDNGKGFDTTHLSDGNGLKNMKKRADEIGGKLWIESNRNEGTLIKLNIAV